MEKLVWPLGAAHHQEEHKVYGPISARDIGAAARSGSSSTSMATQLYGAGFRTKHSDFSRHGNAWSRSVAGVGALLVTAGRGVVQGA
ncbi:hypothetical protein [Amycolatopsis keratiniphila]|uniref:hypothetical protein n=1 Tax=Amycolatopsis keratiniphila TaxID=129921 RepID=UPI00155FD1B1|nr:hypothetical protein [Amycolatopsis keratiniphila]